MPLFVIFVCLWSLLVTTLYAVPRRFHWRMAWALIATGIPLLGLVTMHAGPVFGLAGLGVAAWLLVRAARWASAKAGDR